MLSMQIILNFNTIFCLFVCWYPSHFISLDLFIHLYTRTTTTKNYLFHCCIGWIVWHFSCFSLRKCFWNFFFVNTIFQMKENERWRKKQHIDAVQFDFFPFSMLLLLLFSVLFSESRSKEQIHINMNLFCFWFVIWKRGKAKKNGVKWERRIRWYF